MKLFVAKLFVLLGVVGLMLTAMPGIASAGITGPQWGGCTDGYYTQDVCKYNQSKITLSGSTYAIKARGSTASGTCDPTNNLTWWNYNGGDWYDNGVRVSGWNASSNRTNCSIATSTVFTASRTKVAGHTYKASFKFRYGNASTTLNAARNGSWNMT